MPLFTFEGFAESSFVALSAAQGSVPEWRLSNMNTASLDIARIEPAELVAPVGIWFEATDLSGFNVNEPVDPDGGRAYDPTAHEITFIWDFDDQGTFRTSLNMPTVWNNKNVDYGKKAYHVFEAPGIYSVRLWAIDHEGTIGERTIPVEILDPNTVYSGTRTICVSNRSDFTGEPAGAQRARSLAAAQAAYRSLGQTGRILLRRGETFTESYNINEQQDNHHVGAFGPVEDGVPILRPPVASGGNLVFGGNFNVQLPTEIVYWGLRFEGEWDAAKETGDPRCEPFNLVSWNVTEDWNLLCYQCEFDGMNGIYPYSNETSNTTAFVDCDITNFRSYGVYYGAPPSATSRLAFVGTSVRQKTNACHNGQGNGSGLTNDQSPLRINATAVIMSACDLYSANNWFDTTYVQPALRAFMSSPGEDRGFYLNANRLALEGGVYVVAMGPIDSGVSAETGNFVLDMVLAVSDFSSSGFFSLRCGHTTLRNALMIYPNTARLANPTTGTAHAVPEGSQTAANAASTMNIYNCTLLNLLTGSNSVNEATGASNFTNWTGENNVIHQPNLSSPFTPGAPIDITATISGFTPRNPGQRFSVNPISAGTISVSNGATFTISYPSGTSQADFSAGGRHTVQVGGAFASYYFSYRGDCTFSFGASEITITNTSGTTWSGSARVSLDQDTISTNTALASPSTLPLPVPGANSPALTANGDYQAYTQFGTALRTVPRGAL